MYNDILCELKRNRELLIGIRGFLRFAMENEDVTKDDILSTLLHDVNGTLQNDTMMLPRTDSYKDYGERRERR
jgi:hypothetical protein